MTAWPRRMAGHDHDAWRHRQDAGADRGRADRRLHGRRGARRLPHRVAGAGRRRRPYAHRFDLAGARLVCLPSGRTRRRPPGSPTASTGSRRWSPTPTASPSSPSRCGSSTRRWQRFLEPTPVLGGPMLVVAVARPAGQHRRLLSCCMAATARASTCAARSCTCWATCWARPAAIVAALVILATGWTPIDPILSVLVALLILSTRLVADARCRACAARRRAAELDRDGIASDIVATCRRRARGPPHACLVARRLAEHGDAACLPGRRRRCQHRRAARSRRGWRRDSASPMPPSSRNSASAPTPLCRPEACSCNIERIR